MKLAVPTQVTQCEVGDAVKVCYQCVGAELRLSYVHQGETHESDNIFDHLQSLAAPRLSQLQNELTRFLSTDCELVTDPIAWWNEHHVMYPTLSIMALDYLSIPGEHNLHMILIHH